MSIIAMIINFINLVERNLFPAPSSFALIIVMGIIINVIVGIGIIVIVIVGIILVNLVERNLFPAPSSSHWTKTAQDE